VFELEGTRVPRLFVSSRTGEGVPALRCQLVEELSQRNGESQSERSDPELHGTPA
jgi:GTP-binding protein HflX